MHAERLWRWMGWMMLGAVVVLSLIRIEQPLGLDHADKFEHLLAYGVLMYWWGMVTPNHRLAWVLFLPVLGLLLEGAQALTGYRSLEWGDALANTLGVVFGLGLLATPASGLLAGLDRQIADRSHPRGP